MKKSTKGILLALFIGSLFALTASSASAAYSISGSSKTGGVGIPTAITNLQITGTGTEPIPVKLLVTSGTLAMSSVGGLTFDGAQTGSAIYFSGSLANVNAALATLTYTRGSAGSDTLEVSLVSRGEVFFTGTNHLYEYISDAGTWDAAKPKAEALNRYGAQGYLATITSVEENTFIKDRLLGEGWIGASDATLEGDWKWVTGPEGVSGGTSFWSGAGNGTTVGGMYANWNNLEPNQAGNEDCGQMLVGGGNSGKWNDLTCGAASLAGYVVEFGAPGALPTVAAGNYSITTYAAPVVDSLSPADNATAVAITTPLVMDFSSAVTVGTGNITIKKTSDDSVAQIIPVGSLQVTGAGTDIITIALSASLSNDTAYYVVVDNTAFKDTFNNFFAGIASSTAWNFRTIKSPYVLASEKIQAYADSDGGTTAPTVTDYANAGIVGVTTDTLGVANAAVAATVSTNVDTTIELQTLLTPIVALEKIRLYNQSGGTTTVPTLSDFSDAGVTGVTSGNIAAILANLLVQNSSQMSSLSGIQATVSYFIAQSAPRSSFTTSGSIPSVIAAGKAEASTSVAQGITVRDLTVGMSGEDVRSLQKLLNAQGFTITTKGAGSPGKESAYFGTMTKKALARYQAKFGVKPAIGYFGIVTRTHMKNVGIAGLWW